MLIKIRAANIAIFKLSKKTKKSLQPLSEGEILCKGISFLQTQLIHVANINLLIRGFFQSSLNSLVFKLRCWMSGSTGTQMKMKQHFLFLPFTLSFFSYYDRYLHFAPPLMGSCGLRLLASSVIWKQQQETGEGESDTGLYIPRFSHCHGLKILSHNFLPFRVLINLSFLPSGLGVVTAFQ